VGSILHTTVELIGNETKTKFLHIPYRGEAPAMTGLLQGDIDFIAATSGPISARIRSGEFRALAVTGKTRWRDFLDVPTVAEEGIPGFEVISWTGLAGPAKLPKPIVDKLMPRCAAPFQSPTSRTSSRAWAAIHARPHRPRCVHWWPASSRSGPG
jgi:tripartite-type tricarboxylate transporter receptor subunit TctC